MKEHKILEHQIEWKPPDQRISKFGGGSLPPRKPETRKPVLWLARSGDELYLVNSSEDILDFVLASSVGFQTLDNSVMTISDNQGYKYLNVKPNVAVKIEEYDGFYDLDYVLGIYIKVKSKFFGCMEISPSPEKGGLEETVLLWDNGECGKHVTITKGCE